MTLSRQFLAVAFLFLTLGCSGADVGEECHDYDECEDHAICTPDSDFDHGVCRWVCGKDNDCPRDHECKGVAGINIKSCQPK